MTQNDRLNLSFVKDENTVGEKMTRTGAKRPFILSNLFRGEFSIIFKIVF